MLRPIHHPLKEVQITDNVQAHLKGNTLRTYMLILKSRSGHVGVREVQRTLHFSSPSLAQYHLEKLVQMGLARTQGGEYHLVREVRVEVLQHFIKFGSFIVPRFIISAVVFTVLFIYFMTQVSALNIYSFWAFIFASLATAILWFETILAWRNAP